MVATAMKAVHLTSARLSQVKDRERRLGVVLVALEPQFTVAHLRPAQLKRVQAVEKELGLALVVYQRK
ncbi:MAG: hypothetical protein ACE15C_11225 [Phycisphaerae bacterium]